MEEGFGELSDHTALSFGPHSGGAQAQIDLGLQARCPRQSRQLPTWLSEKVQMERPGWGQGRNRKIKVLVLFWKKKNSPKEQNELYFKTKIASYQFQIRTIVAWGETF